MLDFRVTTFVRLFNSLDWILTNFQVRLGLSVRILKALVWFKKLDEKVSTTDNSELDYVKINFKQNGGELFLIKNQSQNTIHVITHKKQPT